MAPAWRITMSPSPPMDTYNAITTSTHPHGDSVFLTGSSLHPLFDLPGIPYPFLDAHKAGRAIYVTGLPFSFTVEQVEAIFGGTAVALVSLASMCSFLWVVYGTADDAGLAIRELNGEPSRTGGWEVRVVMSLAPHRVVSVVNTLELGELGAEESGDEVGYDSEDDGEKTPTQQTFRAHLPPASLNPKLWERSFSIESATTDDEITRPAATSSSATSSRNSSVDHGVPIIPAVPKFRSESVSPTRSIASSNPILSLSVTSSAKTSLSSEKTRVTAANLPDIPEDSCAPAQSAVAQPTSWARIAGRSPPLTVINVQPRKRVRLNFTGRSAGLEAIRSVDVGAEPLKDQKRVVLLLNLPKKIQLHDVSDAVREGSLARIVFGVNDDDKSRWSGVIFQRAVDATRFYEVLEYERERSRPNRFCFIVDAMYGDLFPANDEIKAMEYPTHATRRLTIVKARFFFMFKEEHLRRLCEKHVGAEAVQLIWLYNGGNATVVFADVTSAMRVKKELDKRAAKAGKDGVPEIWSGLITTYSKDPSLEPMDNLKTALHD